MYGLRVAGGRVSVDVDWSAELLAAVKSGVLAASWTGRHLVDVSHDPDKTFSWDRLRTCYPSAFFVGCGKRPGLAAFRSAWSRVALSWSCRHRRRIRFRRWCSQAITITQKFGK